MQQTPKKKKSFHGFILPPYHNYTYLFINQIFRRGKIICQSYHKLTTFSLFL